MKKLLLSIVLIMSISLAAIATESAESKVDKKGDWLTKDLGLSAEQQTKVDAIFEQQRQKSKALHDETSAQLKEVLTPEQLAKIKEKHKEFDGYHKKSGFTKE